MRKKVVVLFVVVACLLLSACGKGYFRATYKLGENETIDFYEDGTVEMCKGNMIAEGTYERTERNTYDMRMNALFIQIRFTAVREKETLILISESDETKTFTYYLVK